MSGKKGIGCLLPDRIYYFSFKLVWIEGRDINKHSGNGHSSNRELFSMVNQMKHASATYYW